MTWLHARRLPVLLAAATLIPVGALAWLGVRTLQQDRELDGQRRRERLEVAAARVSLEIDRRLQDIEQELAAGEGVRFRADGIESSADTPILFQPVDTAPPEPTPSSLAAAEIDEFQRRDLAGAAVAYRRLARSSQSELRAPALVGLGRVLRASGNYAAARGAYDDLARLGPLVVAGQPAELIARQGRMRVAEAMGDAKTLRAEIDGLAHALYAGHWSIDRPTFELYRDLVVQGGGVQPPAADVVRTEIATELWRAWRRGDLEPRGRRLVAQGATAALALWAADSARATARLLLVTEMARWIAEWKGQGLNIAFFGLDGARIAGDRVTGGVSLAPGDTRLPFMLSASLTSQDDPAAVTRRRLSVFGLIGALIVMVGASYGLYRTTTREIALARQQADFVSSVSHEFRTPLTSMRHLTELLTSNSITSEERKRYYYDLLAHETERLHRMVDSLLSFGRMSAGAYAWQLEAAEVGDVAAALVSEFRGDQVAAGRDVTCDVEADLPPIRADRDALSRALWNLLENAAKYSDAGMPIRVFARRQGDCVLLGVQDAGAGIPSSEHKRIFQKFVRGHDATRAGVRGVGIGLALVSRIVEAHGGSVRLESEPGRGSTFTLVLPCLES